MIMMHPEFGLILGKNVKGQGYTAQVSECLSVNIH